MTQAEFLTIMRKNLKLLRKLRGMSQEQIAICIHVSRSAYAAYETGKMLPNIVTIKKIADFHNLKIDDLLTQNLTFELFKTLSRL